MIFLLTYWKQILIGILIVCVFSGGYYIKSVVADRDAKVAELVTCKKQIDDLANMNKGLNDAITFKDQEITKYTKLLGKLNADKKAIQSDYNAFMRKVEDEKIHITSGIGITEPYVLFSPGMYVGQDSSSSKRSNNP